MVDMKLFLLDLDHVNEKNLVRLWCKDESSQPVVVEVKYLNYFYVLPKEGKLNQFLERFESDDVAKLVERYEIVERKLLGKPVKVVKLYAKKAGDVMDVRNVVKEWEEVEEEYEYTITLSQRFMLDEGITPLSWLEVDGAIKKDGSLDVSYVVEASSVKPTKDLEVPELKVLAFDIEMVEVGEKEKIIMISLATNDGQKKVITSYDWENHPNFVEVVDTEASMINKFVKFVKEYDADVIVGYNTDMFDFVKLRERAEELKIKFSLGRDGSKVKFVRRGRISSAKIVGRVHIDLFDFVNHILSPFLKTEILTLDAVAQELVGVGKLEFKWKQIEQAWKEKKDLDRLAAYSLRDSELTLMLAEELLPQIFAISQLVGSTPFDTARHTYSQLVESYLMRRAVVEEEIILNRPKTDEIARRRSLPAYKGAIVFEPKKGIHTNIVVFDFRSLYPTIIITHNVSPETIDCGHEECKKNKPEEYKHYFCTKVRGFIPRNLEAVLNERLKLKKKLKSLEKGTKEYKSVYNMQYALKIVANATYGYMGYVGARWYCYECAAATAAFGRQYIRKIVEMIKSKGHEIIYGDTDSVFVKFKDVPRDKLKEFSLRLLEEINSNLPGYIELEFRGIYEAGIFVTVKGEARGAKKRYALLSEDGELEIRGFETVRRDWCDLAKWIQHEVLKIILKERDINKALKLVRDTIKRVKNGAAKNDELTIYTQLTMPISQYKALGPHVKAAIKMRQRGRPVGEGMIIGYIITKGSGSISDRAEPAEDVEEGEYDPDYYVNHQILPAAMRVLSALGYTEREVLAGESQKSLDRWFKRS